MLKEARHRIIVVGDISISDLQVGGRCKSPSASALHQPCCNCFQARAASAAVRSTHHSKVVVKRKVPDQCVDVNKDSKKPHNVKCCVAPAGEGLLLLLLHRSLLLCVPAYDDGIMHSAANDRQAVNKAAGSELVALWLVAVQVTSGITVCQETQDFTWQPVHSSDLMHYFTSRRKIRPSGRQ
jgi:hypothetical protein